MKLQSSRQPDYELRRDPAPEAVPEFLALRNGEILNVCCIQLLNFGALDNQYTSPSGTFQ